MFGYPLPISLRPFMGAGVLVVNDRDFVYPWHILVVVSTDQQAFADAKLGFRLTLQPVSSCAACPC